MALKGRERSSRCTLGRPERQRPKVPAVQPQKVEAGVMEVAAAR